MRRNRLFVLVPAAALAASLVLTGCSKSDSSSGSDSTGTTEAAATRPCTVKGAKPTSPPAPTFLGSSGQPEPLTADETANLATIAARGKPDVTVPKDLPADLKITDDVVGTGAEVQATSSVIAEYVGVGADSCQQFDSSWDNGSPIGFPLDGVIQGWSKGLVGMKAGGRRTLTIPGALAYGQNPPPGSGIGPDETLVFVVDMVGVR